MNSYLKSLKIVNGSVLKVGVKSIDFLLLINLDNLLQASPNIQMNGKRFMTPRNHKAKRCQILYNRLLLHLKDCSF